MERQQSLRSKRPLEKDDSPAECNDGELSSGSHGSNPCRRTSPKKTKRAMKKELIQVMYADLFKRTHIVVQEGIPRIKFFTNENLEDLASLCRKRNRNDDKFFEELLDNDKLSQFPLVESNNEPEEKDPDSEDEVPPSPTKKKKYSKREIKENSSEPEQQDHGIRHLMLKIHLDPHYQLTCKNIPPVTEPIPGGESFMYVGSVNTANKSRPQRFHKNE